jgi:hypothetical protein
MRRLFALAAAAALAALAACYPNNGFSTDDAVVTTRDPNADFGSARTFAIPDNVVHLDADGGTTHTDDATDQAIRSELATQMTLRGYTVEPNPQTTPADLYLLPAIGTFAVQAVYTYDPWTAWGFWGGWDPYFGPGLTYAYPAGAVAPYEYDVGTLIVLMLDRRERSLTSRQVPVTWIAVVDGALKNPADLASRAVSGIQRAFVQSPYLVAQ